jgi:uncharacterized protein YbjQ (UPF0145 family)
MVAIIIIAPYAAVLMEMYAAGALEQVRDESIRRLDGGGLPVLAERRLAALFGSQAERFTSQLSVSEFALARSTGLRPVSEVMGSCVYHARLALDSAVPAHTSRPGQPYRMADTVEPWNASRERALDRMSAEARLCGANIVVRVGIRQTQEHLANGTDASVECITSGTAVVYNGPAISRPGPVLTNLSVQDYWKLLRQGYAAVGLVASTTMYGCVPSAETKQAEKSVSMSAASMRSWEIPEFSDGLRLVHATMFAQLRAQAERMGAEGIVGVTLERELMAPTVDRTNYRDLIVVVHGVGTAIIRTTPPPPGKPLTITPVRHLDKKGGIDP